MHACVKKSENGGDGNAMEMKSLWEDKMEKERKEEEVKQKHRRDVEIKRSFCWHQFRFLCLHFRFVFNQIKILFYLPKKIIHYFLYHIFLIV